jgi:putative drug exporter of the RND superfamily
MEFVRLIIGRHRAVLAAAMLLALLGGLAGPTLFGKLSAGGWDNPRAESGRAADLLAAEFGEQRPNLVLLATAPDGVDDPATAAAGTALSRQLAAEPDVVEVVSYWTAGQPPQLRSGAGDRALVLATIDGGANTVDEALADLAPRYRGEHGGLSIQVGGHAMFEHEISEQSERDIVTAELVVFPVTLVALVLIFGSVVAALLPLAVAIVTVLLGMGVMWLLASLTELSVFAVNVVTLLGLGLAIDYSLLMVNRYREELRAGRATAAAIAATVRTAGRTVIFSAITVAIALSALIWFPLAALRSVGYAGITTAVLAGATSLTVLPALLALLGPRVERGRVRRDRTSARTAVEDGFWHRLAMLVMRRPLPIATAVAVLLVLLGAPFLDFNLGRVDERALPESSEARQVATTLRTEFDSAEQYRLQVVIPRPGVEPDRLAGYAAEVSALPHVARVDAATGSYVAGDQVAPPGPVHNGLASGEVTYLSVVPAPGESDDAQRLVHDIRVLPAPADVLVGGQPAVTVDGNATLAAWLPHSAVSLGLAMVVLLFLLTGSLLVPLIALLLSGMSLTATFGALVWIFQEGNLAGWFGDFTATGSLAGPIVVMLFAVAFGLAMDYQVFMLSRIREEYERTGDGAVAVAIGLERIGRIVTAAAVVISIVFLAFLLSDITIMKAFGVGLPLAVLLDATLVRGALLPATMRLAGRATWWAPGPLRAFHRRFGLRESPRESATTAELVEVR